MYRHDLEWQMEELWENYGIEYKFVRSTEGLSSLEFYGGPPSSAMSQSDASSSDVCSRRVVKMQPVSSGIGILPSVRLPAVDVFVLTPTD